MAAEGVEEGEEGAGDEVVAGDAHEAGGDVDEVENVLVPRREEQLPGQRSRRGLGLPVPSTRSRARGEGSGVVTVILREKRMGPRACASPSHRRRDWRVKPGVVTPSAVSSL